MTWTTQPRSDFGTLRAIGDDPRPEIVLIHGVGLRAEAFNAQIAGLGQFRVLAVDMPGHGESTAFDGEPTMADFTDRIADAIQAPAVIVGHSMGAVIAMDMAARYPHKVSALAALNAIFNRSDEATRAICARADALDATQVNDPNPTLQRWFTDLKSPESMACENWLTSVDPAAYKTAYSLFAHQRGPDARALETIRVPALFMTGANEPNSTPQMSIDMARMVTLGRSKIVDGAAHMMPMTHPDLVTQEIRTLIDEVAR